MASPREAGSQLSEKEQVEHTKSTPHHGRSLIHASDDENTFDVEEDELPSGYFKSPFFVGSMTGIGLVLMAGVAGFGYAAPILGIINNDIGPDVNINWVALTYTLTSTVTVTVIGRVTDIFGRRWVFVGGAFLGIVGSIICATAQSVNSLIAGMTITGIAAATQLLYYYVMGELVPMKYRLLGNAFCYSLTIPGSGLAPAIATAFLQNHAGVGWRGAYYVLIGVNTASVLCWFFFYHLPMFWMKHGENASVLKYAKDFDYIGTAMYTGGLLILIMGLGASVYYAFALVWPSMVAVLYEDGNLMTAVWYSSFVSLFIIVGEVVGGVVAKPIGNLKLQCMATVALSGIFFEATATSTPDNRI